MRCRKWLGLSAALWALVMAGGCDLLSIIGMQVSEDFALTLASNGITSLTIDWKNGEVTFRVDTTATQIQASGAKQATAINRSSAQIALEQIEVTLAVASGDSTRAVLKCTKPSQDVMTYSADVEVVVPAGLILSITSTNGTITVTGNTGATTVQLDNGAVTITSHQGDATAKLENGNIEIDSTGGNVTAETTNGSVGVKARPAAIGTVSAKTDVGAVAIQVPKDFAASLTLEARNRLLSVDTDGFLTSDVQATESGTKVTGTINGGGGQITGKTRVGILVFSSLD